MINKDRWYAVKEKSRTYHFSDGTFTIKNVKAIRVSRSHTHFLKASGKNVIIRNNWRAVEIDGRFID